MSPNRARSGPVVRLSDRRAIAAALAVAGATLAGLHDVGRFRPLVRPLLYLAFGGTFAVSLAILARSILRRGESDRVAVEPQPHHAWLITLLPVAAALTVVALTHVTGLTAQTAYQKCVPAALRYEEGWIYVGRLAASDVPRLLWPSTYYGFRNIAYTEMGSFRPLKYLLLWLVSGSPAMTTIVILTMHVLNAAGVAFVARRLGGDVWVSAGAGSLFAVHPVSLFATCSTGLIQVPAGALVCLGALVAHLRFLETGRVRFVWLAALGLALSSFFYEQYLGAVALLLILTAIFAVSDRLKPAAAVGAVLVLVATVATVAFLHSQFTARLVLLTPANLWKRVILSAMFEPHFSFVYPVEELEITTRAKILGMVVAAGVVFVLLSTRWTAPRAAAWVSSGLMLGPALPFFEMTGTWTSGRLAYGVMMLLAIALGCSSPPLLSAPPSLAGRAGTRTCRLALGAAILAAAALNFAQVKDMRAMRLSAPADTIAMSAPRRAPQLAQPNASSRGNAR